jgi:hypothetical protein
MDVVSLCPLPAAALVWQPAPSRWAVTVVCKATFELAPGTASLAPGQEPINEQENHWDDDPNRSLYAPSDLVPHKPRADVILVGSAHAHNAQPVRSLVVRMILGTVDKSIEVYCPRLRTREGEIREGKRWTKMPLLYERAAGGPDSDNPVGMSRDGPRDLYGQVQLPNLQPPGLHVTGDEAVDPIGFGPIAASWPFRRRKLPRGAEERGYHRAPFGEGFDPAFFQVAPLDQQVESIRANERITLENLHPEHLRLVTSLPDLLPRALSELDGSASREIPLAGDTLWIDTHRSICTVTFRGRMDLESEDQQGRILIALGKSHEKIVWTKIAPPVPTRVSVPPPAPSQPVQVDIEAPPTEDLPARPEASSDVDVTEMLEAIEITQSENAARALGEGPPLLPFQPAPPGWKPPAVVSFGPPPRSKGSEVATQKLDMQSFRAALPAWLEATAPSPPAPPPIAPPAPVPVLLRTPEATPLPGPAPTAFRTDTPRPAPVPPPRSEPAPPMPPDGSFSVLDASNAAASTSERPAVRPSALAASTASNSVTASATVATTSAVAAPVVELIWFDPALGPKLARHPAFAKWKRSPPVKASEPPAKAADPDPIADAAAAEERIRGHVYDVLTKGAPTSSRDLEAALEASEEESPPVAPLVLLGGDLELCFDETEVLKAVVSAASPLGGTDKKLKEAIDLAAEMLKTPLQGMPEVAEGLSARIREAWARVNRLLPPSYIAVCTERLLLEQRLYQRRELLDDTWIRALLAGPGGEAPVPAYLPAKIAKRLPLFKRFGARLLAEIVWPQDQYEACPVALRVLALGRLPSRARARSAKVQKKR